MSKRGLPTSVQMRHDSHYVDELSTSSRTFGKTIAINLIAPNPDQPRREIGDLTELSSSIKEKGVLEPLLVRPNRKLGTYMIVAGERRWQASKLAGLTEVPCIEMDLDEQGVAEIALIENLQRKDLTVWEEADGLAALAEKFGYKHDEIAKKISKSRTTVTEFLTIAGLPKSIRERCHEAKIGSKATLLEIARQFDEAAMFEFLDKLLHGSQRPKAGKKSDEPKALKNSDEKMKIQNETDVFSYTPPTKEFEIRITFTDPGSKSKNAVLKALKNTFEAIKIAGDKLG